MFYNAKSYTKALGEYMKVYKKFSNHPPLLKRIAQTIIAEDMLRDTACFFIEKYLEKEKADVEGYYLAAVAHYHAHNFSQASKYLKEYQTMLVGGDPVTIKQAQTLEKCIAVSQKMLKDTLHCRLVNMGEMINSPNNEIFPYISPDDKTLYFSSDEKYNSGILLKYFSIKFAENKDLEWTKSKPVSGPVNTLFDEYVTGVFPGGIFMTSNMESQFSIYQCTEKLPGKFLKNEKMTDPIDLEGDEVGATLSQTGDTLIFSATTRNGMLDLYYSIKRDGQWQEARPLPGEINEEFSDENYPTLSKDGTRLFFASNREGTMGGYDLFYSDLDPRSWTWRKPIQMKYPINDTYDNMSISFSSDERYAFISAIRKDGYGARDIYCVVHDEVAPTTAIMKCFVGIKSKQKPLPLSKMPLIEILDEGDELVGTARLNLQTSTFIMALDPGKYKLHISSDEAKDFTTTIDVPEKVYGQEVIQKIFILE